MKEAGLKIFHGLVLAGVIATMSPTAAPSSSPNDYTSDGDWAKLKWTAGSGKLNLANYKPVWADEFNTCDIGEDHDFQASTPRHDAKSSEAHRWYWTKETFHLATFVPPSANPSPYACNNGLLSLTLSNPTGSQWQSGIISADGSSQKGFTRNFPYSYFETRMKLPKPPAGMMPWPAFWFRSANGTSRGTGTILEIDVIEPGNPSATDPTLQATTLHEWPAHDPKPGEITQPRAIGYNDHYVTFDGQWHTYGLMRTPKWFIMYMDGAEQRRIPVVGREMRQPIYPIIDLAIKYPPTTGTSGRYTIYVDYVRAFACSGGSGGGDPCGR